MIIDKVTITTLNGSEIRVLYSNVLENSEVKFQTIESDTKNEILSTKTVFISIKIRP